jgi:hypothetical protein
MTSNSGRKVVDMMNLKSFMKSFNLYVTPLKIEIIIRSFASTFIHFKQPSFWMLIV